MSDTLSDKTIRASMMTVGARLSSRLVDFVTLLVLARHLGASDFGLVAMAMTVIFVVESIFELPLTAALMRHSEITERMYNTAFTLGLLRGLIVAVLMAVLSLPLAHFYGDDRLVLLICALAMAPAMRGMINPRMVIFDQAMDFRRRAIIELVAKVVAAIIAIILAVMTNSYWAMAASTIAAPTAMMVISYIMLPTRPGFDLTEWRLFSNMTVWSFFSQSVAAVNWQIDRMLLPLYISTASFGRFATANTLAELPYQAVVAPTSSPLYAALVSAKAKGNLSQAYMKACSGLVILMAPVLCFMAFMAGPIIDILLGPAWVETAPILTGLSLASLISVQVIPMPSLAMALDQTRNVAVRAVIEMLVRVPLSIVGIVYFGIEGAIIAKACAAAGVVVASMLAVRKMAGIPLSQQLKINIRPLAALAPALAILYMANHWLDLYSLVYVKTVLVGLVYCVVYTAALYITWLAARRPAGLEANAFILAEKLFSKATKRVSKAR